MKLIAIFALLLAVTAAGKTVSGVQCGVISDAEFCQSTACYTATVNNTCDGSIIEVAAPACDVVYYASFVVTFGDNTFILYESPEREVNGYATIKDALAFTDSVKPLTDCRVTNQTAYLSVKASSNGSNNSDDTLLKVVIGLIVGLAGLSAIIVMCIGVLLVVWFAVHRFRKTEIVV